VNDNDNIILFPTNRIKNSEAAKNPVDEKKHQKLVEEQTKEFVEGNVDDIAYTLLDKFVNMGIRTNQMTFTADLALVIDSIRGLIYRDFNKPHPAQQLTDKMVSINLKGKQKSAKLDYNKVLKVNHKPHKPLSKDIEDEVRDLSDMADIHFTPDFDPENK
tara:strand:- start:153 stop:632 length:480 start_codon:yes stop_codon:yes gene_type:complete